MDLQIAALVLLGLLLVGYFVLAGYDYGVELLYRFVARDEAGRRAVLRAFGPFFLGNEVWLVATGAVLVGAFPVLEGTVLSGLYPLVVVVLLGVVTGFVAVQLRSRHPGRVQRRIWDGAIFGGALVTAVGWGLLVGVLASGVPLGADGRFTFGATLLLSPVVLTCAVTVPVLFAAHGAVFLALRSAGDLAATAAAVAAQLLIVVVALAVLGLAVGVVSGTGATIGNPLAVAGLVLVLVCAAVLASLWVRRGWTGRAFAASCVAVAAPALLVGFAHLPYMLASTVRADLGLTVADAAAAPATLRFVLLASVFVVPVILGYQIWSWWVFRGRAKDRSPTYF